MNFIRRILKRMRNGDNLQKSELNKNTKQITEKCNTSDDHDRLVGNAFVSTFPKTFEGTITTKTREFSRTSIHHPGQTLQEFTDYDIGHDKFRHQYKPEMYANGYDSSSQGYVSLIFCVSDLPDTTIGFKITFLISLVDVEGREIYPQSFTFNINDPPTADNKWPKITIDNYISRSVLLKAATELIPDDTLTLRIEVCLKELHKIAFSYDIYEHFLSPAFEVEEGPDGRKIFLSLRSMVANRLMKESEFFRRMVSTPMREKITGKMEISTEEYETFLTFGAVLWGANSVKFRSVDDVISLYVVAERYGINYMIDTSRHFLKDCFSSETVDAMSEIANFYNDSYLIKAVRLFNDASKESNERFINYCEAYFPPIDRRWICKRLKNDPKYLLMFDCFFDLPVPEDDQEVNFEFYH